MTVLLATDQVALYTSGARDGHGWRQPDDGDPPYWTGTGNLQYAPGVSDPRASSGGGAGPYEPGHDLLAQLFTPEDGKPAEGGWALVEGRRFALSQVRHVPDPTGGSAGCWSATATTVDTWPGATYEREGPT